ncbi:propionaldehyde dehydrogenase [Eubacterium oxidoreducens]|uniref:Propionaldehyde dehydrogenase n=1 Tax=Eubacterium oxidoreducens TaxID=1732 RepID=A0A1G6BRB9_EUBOX|nr:propionaldehyde dehydrogenase [Eubacterium oxidoreducens]
MEAGIFSSVNDAIYLVKKAHERYLMLSLEDRDEIVEAIREKLLPQIEILAMLSQEETGMGNISDKRRKLKAAIANTPGAEDLITEVKTGDRGMTLYELSSFGIICTIEPVGSPAASIVNHVIGMVAAGNAVVICPNPRAAKTSIYVTRIINQVIVETCGIDNLVVCVDESNIAKVQEIIHHPDVDLVVCNAEEDALNGSYGCLKKVIGEGEASSVAMVDETADVSKAAYDIVQSASFDNNLMHTSEKTVVAVKQIQHELEEEFRKNGVCILEREEEITRLERLILREDGLVRRKWMGQSADKILQAAQIPYEGKVKLIVVKTSQYHPFVNREVRAPLIALVGAESYEEGLEMMLAIEQNYKHTAAVHSTSIDRLNEVAKKLQTAVFVKNGPALAGIGMLRANEPFTMMVANVTGEGTVSSRHYTRRRKCMLTNGFSIR